MNALELKIPPPLVALLLAILMWLTPRLAGSLAIPLGLRLGLALALFGFGLCIAVSGVVAFRHARTTVIPIKVSTPSALVSSEVYRFTYAKPNVSRSFASTLCVGSVPIKSAGVALTTSLCGVYQSLPNYSRRTCSRLTLWNGVFGLQSKRSPLAVRLNVSARLFLITTERTL
jgi:hypothetical protein